jgi:hypothetical protein
MGLACVVAMLLTSVCVCWCYISCMKWFINLLIKAAYDIPHTMADIQIFISVLYNVLHLTMQWSLILPSDLYTYGFANCQAVCINMCRPFCSIECYHYSWIRNVYTQVLLWKFYMFCGKVETSSPYSLFMCLSCMVEINGILRVYQQYKNKTWAEP